MYIFTIGELSSTKALVRGLFTTGDTVTITLYDAAAASVALTSSACVEIGVTGVFTFDLDNITTKPSVLETYQWIMDNGIGTQRYDEVRAGGYPDAIAPTGSEALTITIEDGASNPLADVDISILNSAQTLLVGTGRTDANGEYERNIDQGSYKVRLSKNQVDFTVPEDLVVGVGPVAETYIGSVLTQPVPVTPNISRVYGFATTQDGGSVPIEFTGTATITALPEIDGTTFYPGSKITGQYNKANNGEFYWELPYGATVQFKIDQMGVNKQVVIPSQATVSLASLL